MMTDDDQGGWTTHFLSKISRAPKFPTPRGNSIAEQLPNTLILVLLCSVCFEVYLVSLVIKKSRLGIYSNNT